MILGATRSVVTAQNYGIDWFSIDGGGGTSTGGVYAVSGTIGQPDAGVLSGGNYAIEGGFWGIIVAVQTPGAPTLAIVRAGIGQVTISWSPATQGFVLQESASLSPANWTDSPSGAANPITAPAGPGNKFYRLIKPCGLETLDRQQTSGSSVAGSLDQWQSFTAGASGSLTKIELWVSSPTSPSASPGTIRIYGGEGTSGTLLATELVTFSDLSRFQTVALSSPRRVTAGSQYTIRFSVPSISSGWVWFSTDNPYAGGRGSMDPSWDYAFKTYVTPACD